VITQILLDLLVIFGVSILVLLTCHWLRVPAIVGYFVAGIISGPSGFGFVNDFHQVETLAEIGVILLLFTIGMEFSLSQLYRLRKAILVGGSLQVLLTILVSALLVWLGGRPLNESVFVAFLVALSSTAIVLKTLQEKGEIDSPHGRISLGILIFQDIAIVPMILLTPLLSGASGNIGTAVLVLLAKAGGIIVFVVVAAKWVMPRVLYHVTRTRSNELFLMSVMVICFGVAWGTYEVGLSLALGAFLAGLIVSETEYNHAALGNILPFRSVFTTFFFVSIGMMLDLRFFWEHALILTLGTLGVFILKMLVGVLVSVLLGYPLRTSILVGCALGQLGEFSFVLSATGMKQGLFSASDNQVLLAVAILSMAITPLVLSRARGLADLILRIPFPTKRTPDTLLEPEAPLEEQEERLLIVGFGLIGRNVARVAKAACIPYSVIEMNPETVRRERQNGESIFFGDASQDPVLEQVRLPDCRVAVVAINDPVATRRVTEKIRKMNPEIHLIVRTRFVPEMQPLFDLGANEVIPEEFETSVEIFARILTRYFVPRSEIERLVHEIRADNYEMLRNFQGASVTLTDLSQHLHEVEISALKIEAGSVLAGKTLSEAQLRKRHQVSVVAIRRGSAVVPNPGGEMFLEAHDILYLLGSSGDVTRAARLFVPENA
jgi:CPA2 family monovalent cation:H+ antiporter-2